jgi:hypothetical protein
VLAERRGIPSRRVDLDDRRDRAATGNLELLVRQPSAEVGIDFEDGHRLADAV